MLYPQTPPGFERLSILRAPSDVDQLCRMLQQFLQNQTYKERFIVKRGQQLNSVHISQIAYFYSRDKISFIKTHDGKDHTLCMTMLDIEKSVSPAYFYRATRKLIISHAAITKVLMWWNGKLKIEIRPEDQGDEIIISREKAAGFKAWLGE
ncbi:LytR/AlgR family response regulator transcription factor [Chitinophaga lutea]